MTLAQFGIINIGALVTAAGGIFLKRLSDQLDHQAPVLDLAIHAIRSPNLWLGGVCYILPILLWTYLLKYMELTKLQPLLSSVYLYTILMAMLFLNETPGLSRLFGIALIIVGVILVGRS